MELRVLRPDDKEMVWRWRNMPEVSRYMYTDHFISLEEHDAWFSRVLADPTRRYWIIVVEDRDVGLVNLYNLDLHNRRTHWAFYVASPDVRGKGVGSFVEYSILRHVFEELELNKLCCEVLDFNQAVIDMHKSFGFQEEGRFRQHIIKNGKPHDVVCLAMLRGEWLLRKADIEARLRAKGVLQ